MPILRIIHENGICKVPIENFPGKFATLDEADLEVLLGLGVSMVWKFSNGNVWSQSGARKISVARLIVDAGRGQNVMSIDRNPFNLTRNNLAVAVGRAQYRTRDQIDHSPHRLRREVILEHDVR